MTVLSIDTNRERSDELARVLGGVFKDEKVINLTDPMYAVQYCMQHKVGIAFIDIKTRPIDGVEVASLIRKFNKNAKTYLVMDMRGYFIKTNNVITDCLERPVTAETLQKIAGVPFVEEKKRTTVRRLSLPAKRTSVAGKIKKRAAGLKRKVK